ncbi:pseudouridine synthase [Ohtaekwangia koreensis]|uniref:Pseudouridine synthase n=1 Tax=Ohtaekwangia koreensis TaxID=688867 RepID=A0A1T5LHI0_9BACT|nr:pseudouridine synthase [Ohtaekwangia koreensis]SKC75215.1 23S rRNA pseudouridine2605 synthase [Ohtaekwangia koreensis]
MPSRNSNSSSSGRSRGRSSSARPAGKTFKSNSDSSPRGYKKSDRKDSSGKPSFRKKSDEGFDDRKSRSGGSSFSKPGKKFFKSGGKSSDDSSESRGKSFSSRPSGKSFGKPREEGSFRKSSSSERGERSSRPSRGFDKKDSAKPFRSRRDDDSSERRSSSGKPSFGKPRGEGSFRKSSSSERGERSSRPTRGFDKKDSGKPFRGKRDDDSSEGRRSFSKPREEGSFRKSSGERRERPSGSSRGGFDKKDSGKSFRPRREDDSSERTSYTSRRSKSFEEPKEEKSFGKGDSGESSSERSFKKPSLRKLTEDSKGSSSKRRSSSARKDFGPSDEEAPAQTEKIRLNRYIANSGVCSRREADELITMGLISVNGKTITELGYKVNPGDEVRYESKVLRAEKPVYVLMNKPKGYLTTTVDPQERNTVMQLIANHVKERIYPVGRLDRNTTGLLLLTNDGDLADKLMHPSYNVKKIYKVELDRPLTKADFQKIAEGGVHLEEGKVTVDDIAIISDDNKTVGIELHIGWNRVVRRIFESLEYQVVKLDRSVYAGLDKKDLGRGEWRFLKKEEIVRLKHYK